MDWSLWPGVSSPDGNALDQDVIFTLCSTGAVPLPQRSSKCLISPGWTTEKITGIWKCPTLGFCGALNDFWIYNVKGGLWNGFSPFYCYCSHCSCCYHCYVLS